MTADAGRVLEALAEFLRRYWPFLCFWIFFILNHAWRYRTRRKRARAMLDSPLTADWSSRRILPFAGGIEGTWQGRAATLGSFKSGDNNRLAIEATLATPTSGFFLIERAETSLLTRQFRIGLPPIVEPMNPADRVFRVRSSDRTLSDRLLADTTARAALAAALGGPRDEVSLKQGRFVVRRHYPQGDSPDPAVAQSLSALKEMARALG